jgi:hypothetical protein
MNEVMTLEKLNQDNYTILNGKIVDVITDFVDIDTFTLNILIQGDGWQCLYGNFNLFDETFNTKNAIIDLLSMLERKDLCKLADTYVKVAIKDTSQPVEYIGNIISDIWYNFNNYYIKDEEKTVKENVDISEEVKEDEV